MSAATEASTRKIYVTRTGLPISFQLEWPFHHAGSGSDFEVLHAVIMLENSDGLRASVAVNLSATLREELPSLDKKDTEGPVINALRKDVDRKQIEFTKSGKLVPLPFSSRHYNFRTKQWMFGKASDEELRRMIERKVYWQTRLVGGDIWLNDPTEALYLETTTDRLSELANGLSQQGLFTVAKGRATALPALMEQKDRFESEAAAAMRELEEKHAFERG